MKKGKVEKPLAVVLCKGGSISVHCHHQALVDPLELVPHPDNNNDHTEEQVTMMMAMLRKSGWRSVVVVSKRSNLLVAGHLRVRAAIALGMNAVPVDVQYFKDRAAEFKHLTADNELAKLSEFNLEKWVLTAKELEQEMAPEDFQEFIFDAHEFGLEETPALSSEEGDSGQDDHVPTITNPITRKGDVWRMKTHKLMCGDSGLVGNIDGLLGSEKADLIFTDPPYRMDAVDGGSEQPVGKAARKLGERIKHLCAFDPVQFLSNLSRVFDKGVMNAYIFCNKDLVPDYLNFAIEKGWSFNILFWKKPNAIPLGGSHRPDVEYLILLRKSAIWNNGVAGVSYSKCLEFNRELSKDHPTMKPVGLITNEVEISSNLGGIVFEFFMGSGSTLIACEKTGRRCYGIELDETYCDVAVTRWMEYTGEMAWLESTNQTWEEVMVERRASERTTN